MNHTVVRRVGAFTVEQLTRLYRSRILRWIGAAVAAAYLAAPVIGERVGQSAGHKAFDTIEDDINNANLPEEQVEKLRQEAVKKLPGAFKKQVLPEITAIAEEEYGVDLNGDGVVGEPPDADASEEGEMASQAGGDAQPG